MELKYHPIYKCVHKALCINFRARAIISCLITHFRGISSGMTHCATVWSRDDNQTAKKWKSVSSHDKCYVFVTKINR